MINNKDRDCQRAHKFRLDSAIKKSIGEGRDLEVLVLPLIQHTFIHSLFISIIFTFCPDHLHALVTKI